MLSFRKYFEEEDRPELVDGYAPASWYKIPLKNKIIAYHGGSDFDEFSLDHLGSGEHDYGRGMNPALGFGIYFSNCKDIALNYIKYSSGDKALHRVELDTTNLYDQRNGTPHLNKSFDKILESIGKTREDRPFSTYGVYQGIFRMIDKRSAIKLLLDHGIDGIFTRLPSGCYEISVINLKIIKKLDKEVII